MCRSPLSSASTCPWSTDGLEDVSRDRVADSLRQCRAIVLLDPHRCQPYWVLGDPRFTSRAQSPVVRSALRDSRNVHVRGHRWRLGPPPGAVGAAQLPPSQSPRCSLGFSLWCSPQGFHRPANRYSRRHRSNPSPLSRPSGQPARQHAMCAIVCPVGAARGHRSRSRLGLSRALLGTCAGVRYEAPAT